MLLARIINQHPPSNCEHTSECDFFFFALFASLPLWRGRGGRRENRKLPYSTSIQQRLSSETALYRFYLSQDKLFSSLCEKHISSLILHAKINSLPLLWRRFFFCVCICIETFSRDRYVNNSIIKVGKPKHEETKERNFAKWERKGKQKWMTRRRISFLKCEHHHRELKRPKFLAVSRHHIILMALSETGKRGEYHDAAHDAAEIKLTINS